MGLCKVPEFNTGFGITTAVVELGDPYIQHADALAMFLSQLCVFFALVAGNLVELIGDSANDVAAALVFGTAVPAIALMLLGLCFPRLHDRWAMRQGHREVAAAVSALPQGSYPPHMADVDVAHALSTMSQREVAFMLKTPGLEAALSEVFGRPTGSVGEDASGLESSGKAQSRRPKLIL